MAGREDRPSSCPSERKQSSLVERKYAHPFAKTILPDKKAFVVSIFVNPIIFAVYALPGLP
jgi:hypothetical protein